MHLPSMDFACAFSLFPVGHILCPLLSNFSHENIKTEKRNKTKTWVFEKINEIDKLLSKLTKKKVSNY